MNSPVQRLPVVRLLATHLLSRSHCLHRCASLHIRLQLAKRYEAAVRVCTWNSGPRAARARNVGNILEREHELQQQLAQEGGSLAA